MPGHLQVSQVWRLMALLIALGCGLAVTVGGAQAQDVPPAMLDACQFQNPMVGTADMMDALVAGGAMDSEFIGLHQVRPTHHPGIDVQGAVAPLMANGGVVRFAGWDPSGGGWGLVLDGIGPCEGVVMEVWHLPSDPSLVLPVGTQVRGDTLIGRHGFSGVEAQYLAHNHLTLGFRERPNVTWPMYAVDGVWWVHPARVADGAAIMVARRPGALPWWGVALLIVGVVALAWVLPGKLWRDIPVTIIALPLWLVSLRPVRMALLLTTVLVAGMVVLALTSVLAERGVLPSTLRNIASGAGSLARSDQVTPVFHPAVMAWEDEIERWAGLYGLDANLVATVMQVESCGNPQAVSSAGAQGLFQVMPFHFAEGEVMTDPATNAHRGLLFLRTTLAAFPGDVSRALAAYNAGIGGVGSRPPGAWPAETQRYFEWTTGLYADARAGLDSSPTLARWLAAGGNSLCAQALAVQAGDGPMPTAQPNE